MKITIEHSGLTCTVEQDIYTIEETIELVRYVLLGSGFSKSNIDDYLTVC